MFGFLRKKQHINLNNTTNSISFRDDVYIEPESIKITEGLDTRDDLYRVDDLFAYNDKEYLKIASGEIDNIKGRVLPSQLKVRKDIGSDGEVLEYLQHDDEVTIIKAFNGWYNIITSTGICGWCMCCHIDTAINGYNKKSKAIARNNEIKKILKDAENGLVKPTDSPTKIRRFRLF